MFCLHYIYLYLPRINNHGGYVVHILDDITLYDIDWNGPIPTTEDEVANTDIPLEEHDYIYSTAEHHIPTLVRASVKV